MKKLITRFTLLLVIAFGMAAFAFAQNARISGKVTDPHGSVVVGAEVQVINLLTGNKFVTKTGNDGAYDAPFLPASLSDHRERQRLQPGIEATLPSPYGQVSVYDAKLTIGGASEQVYSKCIDRIYIELPLRASRLDFAPYESGRSAYSDGLFLCLIDNIQAYQPEDIYKIMPGVTNTNYNNNVSGNAFAYVRGFSVSQFTNLAGVTYDGMLGPSGGQFAFAFEDVGRVELLNGADGFFYGIGSVGGTF